MLRKDASSSFVQDFIQYHGRKPAGGDLWADETNLYIFENYNTRLEPSEYEVQQVCLLKQPNIEVEKCITFEIIPGIATVMADLDHQLALLIDLSRRRASGFDDLGETTDAIKSLVREEHRASIGEIERGSGLVILRALEDSSCMERFMVQDVRFVVEQLERSCRESIIRLDGENGNIVFVPISENRYFEIEPLKTDDEPNPD